MDHQRCIATSAICLLSAQPSDPARLRLNPAAFWLRRSASSSINDWSAWKDRVVPQISGRSTAAAASSAAGQLSGRSPTRHTFSSMMSLGRGADRRSLRIRHTTRRGPPVLASCLEVVYEHDRGIPSLRASWRHRRAFPARLCRALRLVQVGFGCGSVRGAVSRGRSSTCSSGTDIPISKDIRAMKNAFARCTNSSIFAAETRPTGERAPPSILPAQPARPPREARPSVNMRTTAWSAYRF